MRIAVGTKVRRAKSGPRSEVGEVTGRIMEHHQIKWPDGTYTEAHGKDLIVVASKRRTLE
jgi:hypothetical protein